MLKFAGPWPRACQITDLWILTMSNILFLQVSSQTGQFGKQKSTLSRTNQHRAEKINIEPQLLQLLLLLLLLLLKLFLVPGARGGCQGASGSGDRHSFLRRVTFFLHLFLVSSVSSFFRILCKTGLQTAPKMGSISETSDLAQV